MLKLLYDWEAPYEKWVPSVTYRPALDPNGEVVRDPVGQPVLVQVEKMIPPQLPMVQVLRAGPRQNWAADYVQRAVSQGWVSLDAGHLILHTDQGDVRYRIVQPPSQVKGETRHYYETVRE